MYFKAEVFRRVFPSLTPEKGKKLNENNSTSFSYSQQKKELQKKYDDLLLENKNLTKKINKLETEKKILEYRILPTEAINASFIDFFKKLYTDFEFCFKNALENNTANIINSLLNMVSTFDKLRTNYYITFYQSYNIKEEYRKYIQKERIQTNGAGVSQYEPFDSLESNNELLSSTKIELDKIKRENQKLVEEISKLKREKRELYNENQKTKNELLKIKRENNRLSEQISKINKEKRNNSITIRNNEFLSENYKIKKELEQIKEENNQLIEQISKLNKERLNNSENNKTQKELQQIKEENNILIEENSKLNKNRQNNPVTINNNELLSENNKTQKELEQIKEENNQLVEEISKLNKEKDSLIENISRYQRMLQKYAIDDNLRAESRYKQINSLQNQLTIKENEIQTLRLNNENNNKEKEALDITREQYNTFVDKYNKVLYEKTETQKELEQKKQEFSNLVEQNNKLIKEKSKLTKEICDIKKEKDTLTENISRYQQILQKYAIDDNLRADSRYNQINSLQNQLGIKENEIQTLRSNNERKNEQLKQKQTTENTETKQNINKSSQQLNSSTPRPK